jgi:hypothetical protein
MLPKEYQIVTKDNKEFKKIQASLFDIYNSWRS